MSDETGCMPAPAPVLLTLEETAKRLRKSYCWLSRNWRRLGLSPAKLGRTLLFSPEDVGTVLARYQVHAARPGRPRKIRYPVV